MFRTVFPSISSGVFKTLSTASGICQTDSAGCLLAVTRWNNSFPLAHVPHAVCTVLDSWWWTERPSEICRVLPQN